MTEQDRKRASEGETSCCESGGCGAVDRRTFVKLGGAGLAAWSAAAAGYATAGPFSSQDTIDHFVPVDKKLRPDWVKSLFARGDRTWYAGDDLKTIGMPVGGLCAGQVYLTGDGRLVYWGIFNQRINSGYGRLNYKVGREPTEMVIDNKQVGPAPAIDQGFSIKVVSEAGTQVRSLDRAGFPQVRFCGEYPIGYVDYRGGRFSAAGPAGSVFALHSAQHAKTRRCRPPSSTSRSRILRPTRSKPRSPAGCRTASLAL